MVKIHLRDKVWLTSDIHGFQLAKQRPNGILDPFSYFTSIENALTGFLQFRLRTSEAEVMQTLLDDQKIAITAISEAIRPLKMRFELKEENGKQ